MSRNSYRNKTVNWEDPRTVLDRTARGIIDALTATQEAVPTTEVKDAIERAGGTVTRMGEAIRALRNEGHPIYCHQAAEKSTYKYLGRPEEYEQYGERQYQNVYSRVINVCRVVAGTLIHKPDDPLLRNVHHHALMAAISAGPSIGKHPEEVIAEAKPVVR